MSDEREFNGVFAVSVPLFTIVNRLPRSLRAVFADNGCVKMASWKLLSSRLFLKTGTCCVVSAMSFVVFIISALFYLLNEFVSITRLL